MPDSEFKIRPDANGGKLRQISAELNRILPNAQANAAEWMQVNRKLVQPLIV